MLLPVSTTNAFALPLTIWVPIQTVFVRCASAVSACNTETIFSTGKVSPVSIASSANTSFASRSRQSPGTISPAFRITISPGTTSSIWISWFLPLRNTSTLICTMANNFATAFEALYSCQKPSNPLIITIEKMIEASMMLCKNKERPVANKRIRIIGLLNWLINSVKASDRFCGFRRFAP